MKILQINSHYDKGGAARIVACIHRQLLQKQEESYVAFGRGKRPEEENVYRFDLSCEVYASALAGRITGKHGFYNTAATRRLLTFIEKVQPDVVHLHALHGYYLNLPLLFSYLRKKGLPCVWTFHDCFAFTGDCGYFFECERWKEGCGNCPDIHRYPESKWFDRSAWMWKRKKQMFEVPGMVIVSPSDWLTEMAKASFLGKYECITIRNGIDTAHTFYPRNKQACRKKYGYQPQEKLILGIAAGYHDSRKGAVYMMEMAKALQKEAKVILIGWDEKKNALPADTDNIITLPNTADADMLAEYYSMADVFVLTSLAENYATVVLEAMACGTPVVGFASGGTPEQLKGNRGIVVKTKDQQALNEGVRKALQEDNGLLSGEALAEEIRRENSVEKMTDSYLALYHDVGAKGSEPG